MLIDTHTHLYDEQFHPDLDLILQRALNAGVERMYLPNCDSGTIEAMLKVEQTYPNHCFAMMGLHPCYVKENVHDELAIVRQYLEKRPFCAVGEIGLDYHWDKTFIAQQKEAFRMQIEWAIEFKIPIVIHNREATQDSIDIVKSYVPQGLRGVFHCFSGSYESAKQIIDCGFYLGIGGVLTYKNAGLQQVVREIDLSHLVLETDAPYLTPVPHRGKRNESSYVALVAQRLAELKELPLSEVRRVTTQNALTLFQQNELSSPVV
jgi:TatD DNase family protein